VSAASICSDDSDSEKLTKLETKEKLKDFYFKAVWLETVLESKPQAILQIIFLVERTEGFNNIQGMLTLFWQFFYILLDISKNFGVENNIFLMFFAFFDEKSFIYDLGFLVLASFFESSTYKMTLRVFEN